MRCSICWPLTFHIFLLMPSSRVTVWHVDTWRSYSRGCLTTLRRLSCGHQVHFLLHVNNLPSLCLFCISLPLNKPSAHGGQLNALLFIFGWDKKVHWGLNACAVVNNREVRNWRHALCFSVLVLYHITAMCCFSSCSSLLLHACPSLCGFFSLFDDRSSQ